MGAETKNLDILIRTKAELAGAEELGSSLEKRIGQAKALGNLDEVKKLQPQLDQVNSAIKQATESNKELTEAQGEGSKATEFLHENHKNFYKLLHTMPPEIRSVGTELLMLFRGPIGPAIALFMVVEKVREVLKDYMAELDAQGAEAMQPAVDMVKILQTEWDNTAARMGAYFAALKTAGQNKDHVDEQIKNEKILTDARLDGIKQIVEALGLEQIARLRAENATPEQIAAAEELNKRQLKALDDRKRNADIGSLKKEYADRTAPGYQEELNQKAAATQAQAAADAAKLKSLQGELEKLRGGKDGTGKSPAQEKLEKLEKLMESFENVASGKFFPSDIMAVDQYSFLQHNAGRKGTGRQMLDEDIEDAKREMENEKKRRRQLEAAIQPATEKAAISATEAGNAQVEGKRNAERVAELPGLIDTAGKKNNFEDAAGIIERGVAAEDAVQKSGKATADQVEAITKLRELAEASGTNMTAILRILAISHSQHSTQAQDIEIIKKQFEALATRQTRLESYNHNQ